MEIFRSKVLIGLGMAIMVGLLIYEAYKLVRIIRLCHVQGRQKKREAWQDELESVQLQIEEYEQNIRDNTSLENDRRFEETMASLPASLKMGYIPRHGLPEGGVRKPPIDIPTFKKRYEELLSRRKELERKFGIYTN